MASVNENELKIDNWLHIVTFDITKYVGVGGAVAISEVDGKLTVTFDDVTADDERLHKKFLKLAAATKEAELEPAAI